MITAEPPRMMKMASGRVVPISRQTGSQAPKARKLLLVIQYYAGDQKEAEDLALLISELERTRCHIADILLFGRFDAPELSATLRAKLEVKFDKVMFERCQRRDGVSYPYAANNMFHDLVGIMGQPPFVTDYYAFNNLEPDCTPLRPGWIAELIEGFQKAERGGKSAIGFIHDNPRPHLNGLAVYSTDIGRRVGKGNLVGCSPNVCYDIAAGQILLPHSENSPLIRFKYRHPTISPDELFADPSVVLYHGTKDGSARAAVRARHITFTEARKTVSAMEGEREASAIVAPAVASNVALLSGLLDEKLGLPKRANVYTYLVNRKRDMAPEQAALVAAWRQGWISRGWNPTILTLRDAAQNIRFDEFQTAIEKLPHVGNKQESVNRFNGWLALDSAGGGLLVDMDVLPGEFTPADVLSFDVGLVLSPRESWMISAAIFDAPNVSHFIAAIMGYDPRPEDVVDGRPVVTDMTVWLATKPDAVEPTVMNYGSLGSAAAKLVRFNEPTAEKKNEAMAKFLSGPP